MLKNFKALENIRNSTIGHIHIDYRIACAMINFSLKPDYPHGKNSMYVARRMKSRKDISRNDLEILLSRQLESSLMQKREFLQIADFPKLKCRRLVKSIFQGSYQLRLCKSYLHDLIKNGHAFYPTIQLIKQIGNTKLRKDLIDGNSRLLAVEITSRHRRSDYKNRNESEQEEVQGNRRKKVPKIFKTTYKVFVEYVPFLNHYSSIKSKLKGFLDFICCLD